MAGLVDNVLVRGAGLSHDLISSCMSASLNGSLSEINQLDLKFSDPNWTKLATGLFTLNASVDLDDFAMEVASINTGDDSGVENITVKCRSRIVRALKNRQGTRVLKNASPSDFIISECKAVGAKYRVQSSSNRSQVARDVPKKGQQEVDTPPSSWTTFQRLAQEIGYILFETAGTIYFGKPSFFVSDPANPLLSYRYKTGADDDFRLYSVPQSTRSADSPGQTVDFTVRVPDATRIRTGSRISLTGVPTFNTQYLITQFDMDLLDPAQLCNVTAGVAMNPDASLTTKGSSYPRQGTQLASDLVYWVRKQLGVRYATGSEVNLGGSGAGSTFDGAELVQWAAAQVGVFVPDGADNIINYAQNFGTLTSVSRAATFAGGIVWRSGYMGVSLGKNQIVEQVNGKIGIRAGDPTKRYTQGAFIPGVKY